MNILFINDQPMNPLYGGIERVTDILAKAFVKKGQSVYYYTFFTHAGSILDYDFPAELHMLPNKDIQNPQNKQVYLQFLQDKQINLIINQRGLLPQANFFLEDLPANIRVISVFHNKPFGYWDVYWQSLFANRYGIEGWVKCMIKGLLFPYFLLINKKQEYNQLKHQIEWVVGKSDKAVFLSESYVHLVKDRCQADANKLVAIPNPNTYDTVQKAEKESMILYVGRLDAWQKQSMTILKIWNEVEKKHPHWHLAIVGHGNQESRMLRWAKCHHLQRVEFMGKQDPRPFYEKAQILLLVSNFEGFPMVVTEAMQHGVIPMVMNTFCAAEMMTDGQSGRILPPFDKLSFVKALDELMSDEQQRISMRKQAEEYVKQFNQEQITNQWFQLLSQFTM